MGEHIRIQNECSVQLHGKGSHHLEPDTGQELNESMFLRIVAEQDVLSSAIMMVQDLLRSVYEEHQNWCSQRSLPPPPPSSQSSSWRHRRVVWSSLHTTVE